MKMHSHTAAILVLVALGGCSSFNSAYSPPVDDAPAFRGAALTVYPFLVTTEAYEDEWTASVDATYAFANEITGRGTTEVVVAEYVFSAPPREIDTADESSEGSSPSAGEAELERAEAELLQLVFTERDLLQYAEQSTDEFFVIGLVEQYNLLNV